VVVVSAVFVLVVAACGSGSGAKGGLQRAELSDPNWIVVEHTDDPEATEELAVIYSDAIAVEHEDLVEASVKVVARFPGVTEARHEDRELIVVFGTRNARGLEAALRSWWADRARP
jgi:hypothetical protein